MSQQERATQAPIEELAALVGRRMADECPLTDWDDGYNAGVRAACGEFVKQAALSGAAPSTAAVPLTDEQLQKIIFRHTNVDAPYIRAIARDVEAAALAAPSTVPPPVSTAYVKDGKWVHEEGYFGAPLQVLPPSAPPGDALDAKRYRWLQEHTVATGLSRWMGSKQFLNAAVDEALAALPVPAEVAGNGLGVPASPSGSTLQPPSSASAAIPNANTTERD